MSFFFFQAEDGIRDADVTGVQTCALPISCFVALRTLNLLSRWNSLQRQRTHGARKSSLESFHLRLFVRSLVIQSASQVAWPRLCWHDGESLSRFPAAVLLVVEGNPGRLEDNHTLILRAGGIEECQVQDLLFLLPNKLLLE